MSCKLVVNSIASWIDRRSWWQFLKLRRQWHLNFYFWICTCSPILFHLIANRRLNVHGNLSRMFDLSFTTMLRSTGFGLGLTFVYNLVNETLRGKIQIASKLNARTSVSMIFPKVERKMKTQLKKLQMKLIEQELNRFRDLWLELPSYLKNQLLKITSNMRHEAKGGIFFL